MRRQYGDTDNRVIHFCSSSVPLSYVNYQERTQKSKSKSYINLQLSSRQLRLSIKYLISLKLSYF